ncbi:oxidoreductase [Martelella endophytica]|uniref:Oxidoreductase n=2 Tax=Martelella endophytica TaxID=1486262 RepID=A0A0D5LMT8_MAREN|nr:oxidoreductase [Martelella endophytica]
MLLSALAATLLFGVGDLSASELRQPDGPIILTVEGAITNVNTPDGKAEFDMAMLDALPQRRFRTATIWTSGVSEFSGPTLTALLAFVGAKGKTLRLTALNEYAVEMPAADAFADGPILATRKDGRTLSVRDNGPLWLIYPFDDEPAYKTEVTYSRSIWQLKSIEVKD